MQIAYGLLNLLVPLAVIGGIVAAVVAWTRRDRLEVEEEEENKGIGMVKRLYFYAATFAYMVVAGVGVSLVGSYVLDRLFGPAVLSGGTARLAAGVALALIWTPMWVWHRLRVQRFAEEEPAEPRSILRKLYAYLTVGVSAALVTHASVELLRWLFGEKPFSGYPVAALAVWAPLWAFHWVAEGSEGQLTAETRTVRRLYLYVTSAYGLAMMAVGASFAFYLVLRNAYEGLFPVRLLLKGEEGLWGDDMRVSLSVALVGAGVWAFHWLYAARGDAESTVRQFYLYAFAVLGGVITALSATGVIVFGVLQWFIGTPEEAAAADHFRFLPGTISPLVIGLALWLYHWTTVRQEQALLRRLPAARRIYFHIMAALGLGALAAAIVVLIPTVIGIAVTSAREVLVGTDWWRDRMVLVVTLAFVGTPVWAYHWLSMQRRVTVGDAEERASLPRRILVWGVLVLGALAFLGNLSYLLFAFLNAVLEDNLSLTLLRDAKWSLGAAGAAVLIAPYYWLVWQEDRQAAGEPAARPAVLQKSVTVLIPAGGDTFLAELEAALDGKVRVLHRLDPDVGVPRLSADDFGGLERRIAEAAGSRVLLIADAAGVQVMSYR
jgi:hypothetical protein